MPPGTRVDEFEAAMRAVCEPIFDRPLKEISFGRVLLRLFQTARRFNLEVQPQLVMLQKTLLNIEGLGRQLDPDLDLWTTAKPYLERWMQEQIGWRGLVRDHPAARRRPGRTSCRSCRASPIARSPRTACSASRTGSRRSWSRRSGARGRCERSPGCSRCAPWPPSGSSCAADRGSLRRARPGRIRAP